MSHNPGSLTPHIPAEPRIETRESFRHFLVIPTRWMDNDVYGHVNNVVYYSYFDTVINEYLIREGGLDIHDGRWSATPWKPSAASIVPSPFPNPSTRA